MESNNRKIKRGARGSIEEETNVAKHSNMADCEEVEELDASSSEPSLSDIKEMLVDIKNYSDSDTSGQSTTKRRNKGTKGRPEQQQEGN